MPGHQLRHHIRNNLQHPLITYNNPPQEEKHLGTKDFMFELVIENEQGPFFSEKLIDAMLVGCIPVYWSRGKHDVSLEVFDRDGIITFEDVEELYEMLRNQQDHFNVDVYTSKMKAIKKLQEHNIFKKDSIVESVITKDWMGSPVEKKVHLIVRKLRKDDCLCEEYGEADGIAYKIKYLDITTIDGQEPNELAAVYGLGPKTARFKRKIQNK